ncbi:MAG: DUF4133 domain-containing protein, partial [Spirochaetales bacterium]|nr:DUF4133 domain-containing protein [Spirochaetales bacterium]
GSGTVVCIGVGGSGSVLIIWKTFSLNKKYGQHGLMKIQAKKRHPRYIICRKPVYRHLKHNKKQSA